MLSEVYVDNFVFAEDGDNFGAQLASASDAEDIFHDFIINAALELVYLPSGTHFHSLQITLFEAQVAYLNRPIGPVVYPHEGHQSGRRGVLPHLLKNIRRCIASLIVGLI